MRTLLPVAMHRKTEHLLNPKTLMDCLLCRILPTCVLQLVSHNAPRSLPFDDDTLSSDGLYDLRREQFPLFVLFLLLTRAGGVLRVGNMWQRLLARLTGMPAAPRLQRSVKVPFGAELLKNQNVRVYSAVQKSAVACEIRVVERPADHPEEDRAVFAALEAVGVSVQGTSVQDSSSQRKGEKSAKLDAVIVNLAAAPTTPALISAVAREFSGSILTALNPCASVLVVARNDTLDLAGGGTWVSLRLCAPFREN